LFVLVVLDQRLVGGIFLSQGSIFFIFFEHALPAPRTGSVLAYRRARPLLRRAQAVFPRSVSLDFVADSFTNGSALPHPGHVDLTRESCR
jgi:hypothetical protein